MSSDFEDGKWVQRAVGSKTDLGTVFESCYWQKPYWGYKVCAPYDLVAMDWWTITAILKDGVLFGNWRLPTIAELELIHDEIHNGCEYKFTTFTNNVGSICNPYWSSEMFNSISAYSYNFPIPHLSKDSDGVDERWPEFSWKNVCDKTRKLGVRLVQTIEY